MIRVVVEENTRRLGSVFVSEGAGPLIYSRDETALINALAKAYLALLGEGAQDANGSTTRNAAHTGVLTEGNDV